MIQLNTEKRHVHVPKKESVHPVAHPKKKGRKRKFSGKLFTPKEPQPNFLSDIFRVLKHDGLRQFYNKYFARCFRKPELYHTPKPGERGHTVALKFFIDDQQMDVSGKHPVYEKAILQAMNTLNKKLNNYTTSYPNAPERLSARDKRKRQKTKLQEIDPEFLQKKGIRRPLVPFKPTHGLVTNYRGRILDFYNQNRERCAKAPILELKKVEGPAHDRRFVFTYTFWLDGKAIKTEYRDRTKKDAMRECAVAMYIELCKIIERECKSLGEVLDPSFLSHYEELKKQTRIDDLEKRQQKRKQHVDVHPIQALQRFAQNKSGCTQPSFVNDETFPRSNRKFGFKCEMLYQGKLLIGVGTAGSKKRAKMDAAQSVIDQIPECQRYVASLRRRRERERNPKNPMSEHQKLHSIAEEKYERYLNFIYTRGNNSDQETANTLYSDYQKAFEEYRTSYESHKNRQETAMRLAGIVQRNPSLQLFGMPINTINNILSPSLPQPLTPHGAPVQGGTLIPINAAPSLTPLGFPNLGNGITLQGYSHQMPHFTTMVSPSLPTQPQQIAFPFS